MNICVVHQHIGYKKDLLNKNKLIIDEKTSDIVRLIFEMYEKGTGSKSIVEFLNEKKYLSPLGYRKTGIVRDENKTNYNWNATTLCAMLKNECYIGNTVQNKVSVVSYKVKKVRKVEKGRYIKVENTHEPIIDKELFEKVQALHQKRAKIYEKQYKYLLKGLLYCKHCRWQLQIVSKGQKDTNRAKIQYIVDSDYKKRICYPRNINYYKFEEQILEIVRNICKKYANKKLLQETYKKAQDKTIDKIELLKRQIENLTMQINSINNKLDKLYDDKLGGLIESYDFTRISNKYIKEREEKEIKLSEIKEQLELVQEQKKIQDKVNNQKVNALIEEFLKMEKVEKSYLYKLIDKIEIDKDKNVFISFKFASLNEKCDNAYEFFELRNREI